MITNLSVVLPLSVIQFQDSCYQFFITGSRFFGGVHENSDWDFMVQESPEVEAFLKENGFEHDEQTSYSDSTITKVYKKVDKQYGKEYKIDVQLVVNVIDKLTIQDILSHRWVDGLPGDKETKRQIWNAAVAVFYTRQRG